MCNSCNMKIIASNHFYVVNHTCWYSSEYSQAYRDDLKTWFIAFALIFYIAVSPCICFCVVSCIKKVTMCQCEKPPSANLVCEGLWILILLWRSHLAIPDSLLEWLITFFFINFKLLGGHCCQAVIMTPKNRITQPCRLKGLSVLFPLNKRWL